MSSKEDSLVERIGSISNGALDGGWKVTKEAVASADQQRKEELTQQAELLYISPSSEIAREILFGNPSDEMLKFLTGEFLKTEINVFDLYRRVGRIDEARELGEKTLERSVDVEDTSLINRCGNKLNLVRSAEAYNYLAANDFERAYTAFSEIERIFGSMNTTSPQGKEAITFYSTRAANLLNMVDISISRGISAEDVDRNLLFAEEYNLKSRNFVDNSDLSDEDRSIWLANIHHDLGLIHQFRGDLDGAIKDYRIALSTSKKGSEYNLQIMTLNVRLTNALISSQNPIYTDEIKSNYELIDRYISEGKNFGINDPLINPLVGRIRTWNENH